MDGRDAGRSGIAHRNPRFICFALQPPPVADWIVEFAWSVRTGKPTATTRRVDILDGVFVKGAPNPPDTSANIVVARSRPTANKQDDDAVNAIFNRRRAPLLRESRTWPPGFRTDFFT